MGRCRRYGRNGGSWVEDQHDFLNAAGIWQQHPYTGAVRPGDVVVVCLEPTEQNKRYVGPGAWDGKIHRLAVEGDKGTERNGSYRAFADGVPNGWHQNFKTYEKPIAWRGGAELTEQQRTELARTAAASRRAAEQQREQEAA